MEICTLSAPPIVEALVEIRFNPNKAVTLKKLEKFAESLKEHYPKIEPLNSQTLDIKISGEEEPEHNFKNVPVGFRLTNIQNNRVVIIAIDKLIISFQSPYTPWPSLKEKTKEIFDKYCSAVEQKETVRVGMRYINRVDLPLGDGFTFQNYINTFPALPESDSLPTSISRFETSVLMPLPEIDSAVTIRQVLLDAQDDNEGNKKYLPFILDLDVFQEKNLSISESENIWELLDIMRDKKNAIFFSTFTDEALKPYE